MRLKRLLLFFGLSATAFIALFSYENVGGTGLFMPNNVALWFLATSFILVSLYKVISSQKINYSQFGFFLASRCY